MKLSTLIPILAANLDATSSLDYSIKLSNKKVNSDVKPKKVNKEKKAKRKAQKQARRDNRWVLEK